MIDNKTKEIIVDMHTTGIFKETISNIMMLSELSKACDCDKRDCGCCIIDVDGQHIYRDKAYKYLEKIKEYVKNI